MDNGKEPGILKKEEAFVRRIISGHFGQEAGAGELFPVKYGMMNRSYLFSAGKERYIFRCNGVGTEQLIDRDNEAKIYELIRPLGIAEDVVALSVDGGYKISHYYEHSRVCDGHTREDVERCMSVLHALHNRGLTGAKPFDPFKLLLFYEDVRKERTTDVPEYADVKEEVFSLRAFLEPYLTKHLTLCHVDSVSDNFLFVEGRESPYLIDWEYAGLSDPLLDVAMFAIYDNFSEEETERLLQAYFPDGCSAQERARVYAYMAAVCCGTTGASIRRASGSRSGRMSRISTVSRRPIRKKCVGSWEAYDKTLSAVALSWHIERFSLGTE
ncbi:choline kinase family protein [Selenomonas sp. F0473]|uniref:choline kinase family protein n=1 Tax=Selenomonas sp. F0473 TaxID=999423 RepID=UPI00029E863E|nr:choline kinase family protein [Selenomonas sp. F0473]EKU72055.1 hypothetical protein HMPREF9161_00740 [Selenomonas sp. F0473]